MNKSQLQAKFSLLWEEKGLPGADLVEEYQFCKGRMWRYDFAFPSQKLVIDIQGMGRGGRQGGHQTAEGMRNDCDKHNTATLMGYRVLLFASSSNSIEEWVYLTCVALCYQQAPLNDEFQDARDSEPEQIPQVRKFAPRKALTKAQVPKKRRVKPTRSSLKNRSRSS